MTLTKYSLSRWTTQRGWFSFARNVATRCPNGVAVAADVSRWSFERNLAGLWGDEEALESLSSLSNADILAAGYDSGTGSNCFPLLVAQSASTLRFNWGASLENTVFRTMYNRYGLVGSTHINIGPDIRSATGDVQDDVCYVPKTGVICFGTMVIICEVFRFAAATWSPVGTAIAYSLDGLNTSIAPQFTIYYDDSEASPISLNEPRINTWSCTNWYCP